MNAWVITSFAVGSIYGIPLMRVLLLKGGDIKFYNTCPCLHAPTSFDLPNASAQDLLYRCRKCRNLIATSSNVASSYTVKLPNGGRPQFSGKRMSKDTGLSSFSPLPS